MSDLMRSLQKKIKTTHSLKSVVKTMKILAAINSTAYEKSVTALEHYYETVKLGLITCFLQSPQLMQAVGGKDVKIKRTGVVIFGSDQGMVGQFNDQIAEYSYKELSRLPTEKIVWSVGERVHSKLMEYRGLELKAPFNVASSITNIATLISQILDHFGEERKIAEVDQLLIFYNKSAAKTTFEPTCLILLPLDKKWLQSFMLKKWPTNMFPEVIDGTEHTFSVLIREHLFASIVKACAESLASENASRLASMQLAEKHIDDLLNELSIKFNLERQNSIDEELFDLVSGFEVITAGAHKFS
jgi:F-type H+-transporting ATPase subunit gamma